LGSVAIGVKLRAGVLLLRGFNAAAEDADERQHRDRARHTPDITRTHR